MIIYPDIYNASLAELPDNTLNIIAYLTSS